MFGIKNIYYYAFVFSLIAISTYIGTSFNDAFKPHDEYDLIKKYLLNDSPLYGFNRPKIWIHTKYEYNARQWKSFQSRSSYDLNQPYIHLTIKSIIDHCGEDFHICLIDDNTFSKLIPSWETDMSTLAEPMKSLVRQAGMVELVYYYGGMVLPNSFLCTKPLLPFYNAAVEGGRAFVCEQVNHSVNLAKHQQRYAFLPNTYIMGAAKNNGTIKELVVYLKKRNQQMHFSHERIFSGDTEQWCMDAIAADKMRLIGGEQVGVKTANRKPVLLDNLMEEEYLDFSESCVGIYIPGDEILKRTKYQWFAAMSTDELLNTHTILTKHLKAALVDGAGLFYSNPSTEQKSISSL